MTVAVRRAELGDLAFVGRGGELPPQVLARKVEAGEVWLALRDGEPVGYLRLEYLWSTLPYIGLIRVLEPHRRQGVGRRLLAAAEEELRAAGCAALYSSSQADEPERGERRRRRRGLLPQGPAVSGRPQWALAPP